MTTRPSALAVCAFLVPLAVISIAAQLPNLAEDEPIQYSKTTPTDPVARLQQKLDAGTATLEYDEQHGYLPSLLKHLDVAVSSQGLVFSRTSLQVNRIAPWSPRAIYFNDDVYVGWVQDGPMMEIASVDPKLGAVFYTLSQERTDHPKLERQTHTCLQCHDSSSITGGVPGFIMRSVFTDKYGYPLTTARDIGATTDRTPIDERWGGWYVTGTAGEQAHVGNLMASVPAAEIGDAQKYSSSLTIGPNLNVTDLHSRFDVDPYLGPSSDIVALMVLAHQTSVHNLITIANFQARKALYDEDLVRTAKSAGAGSGHLDSTLVQVQGVAERLVDAMLFVKAAPLTAPMQGTSSFAHDFASLGPRDRQGRSLRDLDLKTRLFKYPLSYLIYSESFDALPDVVKDSVYKRLREVLTGADTRPEFAQLTPADRQSILEILTDTKPDFAKAATPGL